MPQIWRRSSLGHLAKAGRGAMHLLWDARCNSVGSPTTPLWDTRAPQRDPHGTPKGSPRAPLRAPHALPRDPHTPPRDPPLSPQGIPLAPPRDPPLHLLSTPGYPRHRTSAPQPRLLHGQQVPRAGWRDPKVAACPPPSPPSSTQPLTQTPGDLHRVSLCKQRGARVPPHPAAPTLGRGCLQTTPNWAFPPLFFFFVNINPFLLLFKLFKNLSAAGAPCKTGCPPKPPSQHP